MTAVFILMTVIAYSIAGGALWLVAVMWWTERSPKAATAARRASGAPSGGQLPAGGDTAARTR
jgi:hypothetical protein